MPLLIVTIGVLTLASCVASTATASPKIAVLRREPESHNPDVEALVEDVPENLRRSNLADEVKPMAFAHDKEVGRNTRRQVNHRHHFARFKGRSGNSMIVIALVVILVVGIGAGIAIWHRQSEGAASDGDRPEAVSPEQPETNAASPATNAEHQAESPEVVTKAESPEDVSPEQTGTEQAAPSKSLKRYDSLEVPELTPTEKAEVRQQGEQLDQLTAVMRRTATGTAVVMTGDDSTSGDDNLEIY